MGTKRRKILQPSVQILLLPAMIGITVCVKTITIVLCNKTRPIHGLGYLYLLDLLYVNLHFPYSFQSRVNVKIYFIGV